MHLLYILMSHWQSYVATFQSSIIVAILYAFLFYFHTQIYYLNIQYAHVHFLYCLEDVA